MSAPQQPESGYGTFKNGQQNDYDAGSSHQRLVVMTSRYPLDHPGGVERVVANLVRQFEEGPGHWRAVHVFAFESHRGVATIPLVGDLLAAIRLARRVNRRADAILVHGAEYAWPFLIRSSHSQPCVVAWHGLRSLEAVPPPRRVSGRIELRVYRFAARILERFALRGATVAVSPSVAEDIKRHLGFSGEVHVAPNGIAPSSGASYIAPGAGRPGVRQTQLRAVWIGTSPYKKGLDVAVAACVEARRRGTAVTLTVVGVPASALPPLQTGGESWITCLGRLMPAEVDELWACHDVLLFPTRYEGCSMTVLEALASGTPVVGSSVIEWQVGDAGRVVQDESPDKYARALVELADEQVLAGLSAQAVLRASMFSWGRTAALYSAVLDAASSRTTHLLSTARGPDHQ